MIIGKPLLSTTPPLKAEITVTARAGSTLDLHFQNSAVILQTYTLTSAETTHTFRVRTSTTAYVITDSTVGKSSTPVSVDEVAQYNVEIIYQTYLYNEGNEYTALTGGWTLGARNNQTQTTAQGHIYVDCYARTNQAIDITNFTTLYMQVECPIAGSNNNADVTVFLGTDENIRYWGWLGAGSGKVIQSLNISSFTGSYQITVSASNQTWISYQSARYSKQSTYLSLSAYSNTRLLYYYKVWLE